MPYDWSTPYHSRRQPIFARNVVATSQPLAVQAGMAMLSRGGNAVDAALATAIALTVVEPCSNGLGSDLFAILWDGRELVGLNASGRAPAAVLGKPDPAMLHGILHKHNLRPEELAMVGDRLYTDVAMAHRAGAFGVLVLTGETNGQQASQHLPPPDLIVPTLTEFGIQLRAAHQSARAV